MSTPYEGLTEVTSAETNELDSVQNRSPVDEQQLELPTIEDILNNPLPEESDLEQVNQQAVQQETPTEPSPESEVTEPAKGSNNERWTDLQAWARLPNGPEKTEAQEAWAMKHHGMTYDEYKKTKRNQGFLYGGGKSPTEFYGYGGQFHQRLGAAGTGLLDTATDFVNLIPGINLPKATPFEDGLSQGIRNISGIVLPALFIEGKIISAGAKLHATGKAPLWVQKLGNNPIFQRFAYKGIGSGTDIGSNVLVDVVAEQNKFNDTLATEWKNNQWLFHQWIPDSWTSDKLSPDQKARANAMEGVRIGFVASIFKGLTKIIKAGNSIERASKYVAESNIKQKDLDKLIHDPLDDVKYSDNPIEDEILRQEAKYQREKTNLSNYLEGKGPLTDLKEPTLGAHDLGEGYETAIRTKDSDGVVGAAADQARIVKNKGTTKGRLANTLSEATRKLGLEADSVADRTLVKGLTKDIKKAGKYSLKGTTNVSWKEIDEAGTGLANILVNPQTPTNTLKKILNEFKVTIDGVKQLDEIGFNATKKAMQKYMDDFLDIDAQKAKAYLITSEAGQVSDIAEGARLVDAPNAIVRAQEQILDRLELLTVENSIAAYEWGLRNNALRTWKNYVKNGKKESVRQAKQIVDDLDSQIAEIIPNAKNWIDTLRDTAKSNPEYLKPLMLAYEFSNGDIHSIHKLNKYVENSLGTFSKAFVDFNPEIPSIINRAYWSTIYNSILSAFSTPQKALLGNFGGMVSQMTGNFYGALREGDAEMLRRASHQYLGLVDTLQVGWKHMSEVFSKASKDPNSISYVIREDLILKEAEGLDVLKATAKAHEENGEYGASAMITLFEEQEALAKHPWLRFGPNAMTALDGFSRAVNKLANDKGEMFDLLLKKYPDGNWSQAEFQEGWKALYAKNWDENGMITDEAVDFATREIALNLNTPFVEGLSNMMKHVPILRSILMFPKTSMNVLDIFTKYSPLSRVHLGHKFAGDYAKFLGSVGNRKAESFSLEEIRELLSSRGISMEGNYMNKFKAVRNELRGRVAAGSLSVMTAWTLVTQDRLRGNGHWDRQVQASRRAAGWVPKTYKGLDGNWHSYEWMGPIGDWLALTTDVMDNFDSVSTTQLEHIGKKLSFILGASITNRSLLANLDPLSDIFNGNPTAAARWASNLTNSMLPLGGQRNELGRAMYPMLKELDNDNYLQLIQNRNKWLEAVDPVGANPTMYDWLSGKPIIRGTGTWFNNFRNSYTPFKVFPDNSKEQQFLIDIEYDKTPHFNVSAGGVEYTNSERAELSKLVGTQGLFKKKLQRIMVDANRITVEIDGKTIKGYREILLHIRRTGRGSDFFKTDKFANIERRIDLALADSIRIAENYLSNIDDIRRRKAEAHLKEAATMEADIPRLLELNQPSLRN